MLANSLASLQSEESERLQVALADHAAVDAYCDARLGRKPQAAPHYLEHHIGEDYAVYAESYYRSYRAAREEQRQ